MKYLSSAPFSIGPAAKSTCCEACVYGSGDHAKFCDFWLVPPKAITRNGKDSVINLNVWYAENRKARERFMRKRF